MRPWADWLLVKTLSGVSPRERASSCAVSSSWYGVAADENVWSSLLMLNFRYSSEISEGSSLRVYGLRQRYHATLRAGRLTEHGLRLPVCAKILANERLIICQKCQVAVVPPRAYKPEVHALSLEAVTPGSLVPPSEAVLLLQYEPPRPRDCAAMEILMHENRLYLSTYDAVLVYDMYDAEDPSSFAPRFLARLDLPVRVVEVLRGLPSAHLFQLAGPDHLVLGARCWLICWDVWALRLMHATELPELNLTYQGARGLVGRHLYWRASPGDRVVFLDVVMPHEVQCFALPFRMRELVVDTMKQQGSVWLLAAVDSENHLRVAHCDPDSGEVALRGLWLLPRDSFQMPCHIDLFGGRLASLWSGIDGITLLVWDPAGGLGGRRTRKVDSAAVSVEICGDILFLETSIAGPNSIWVVDFDCLDVLLSLSSSGTVAIRDWGFVTFGCGTEGGFRLSVWKPSPEAHALPTA